MDDNDNTLPEGLDFGSELVEDTPDDVVDLAADDSAAPDADEAPAPTDEPVVGDDEPDETPETDPEEDEEEEQEAPQPKAAKGPRIPKERFDQALRKQRAAEQRVQDMTAELAQVRAEIAQANVPKPISTEEIQAKMAEANEALIAGDTAKAAQLQAEVMSALVAKPQAPAPEAAPERDLAAEVEARIEFKATLKDVYARYPELDENGSEFNEEIATESVALQINMMNRGFTAAEATERAAKAIAKLYDLEDRIKPAEPKPDRAAKLEQEAKTKAKVLKATKAAPTIGTNRENNDEPVFDINNATPEEFMALPKSAQDRLLGNTL